ncbi:cobaltochelatase subunit CobN [Mesorhizobium sp. GR13]|uniref:cobaltochelatase subunit CobN n=1 Tax=Mesorhizobium sp. GR13 TaxID=2562308 RepID=UPI0010BFF6D6|nr:cobaltochelatase subunit CobN [Mesorhizobium sp. GR13]
MHILATTSASLEDLIEPVDLKQTPADVVALSFTDSDLAALAAGWQAQKDALPSLGLAALRDLRHPMSVDLWIDSVARHAKVILVRILGGYDWWRYGCDQLASIASAQGIKLALLPGECREDDARLAELSTVGPDELAHLLGFFREGGPGNMQALARSLGAMARGEESSETASEVPKAGFYVPAGKGQNILSAHQPADRRLRGESEQLSDSQTQPIIPILFYRSMLLAADAAPIDELTRALEARGISAVPIFVTSLKDPASLAFVEKALAELNPAAIITATAFAAGAEPGEQTLFDRAGVPVFQVITATTRREAWEENQRGLAPADLAMHVVLPELDGRILAGAISFKAQSQSNDYRGLSNQPEPNRIEQVAARIERFLRLADTTRENRKLLILIPDYPAAEGRTGYAVGLDVPSSVLAMLNDLRDAGYIVDSIPESPRELLDLLDRGSEGFNADDYAKALATLPDAAREKLIATWGGPSENRINFRASTFGNVTVALAPDRGRSADRRADYHDPTLAPQHDLVAFGFWLQNALGVHAIIHVGAHGTLEWLPGKTVALSRDCFPEIVTGGLPVIYPFIVSNPGEAAQAKRRISAITLGHLPPPLARAELDEKQQKLQRLVDEYAQADGLDRRRRDRLARLIVETATETGLATDAGVARTDAPDEALRRIDAWLCDLKDFAIKDGLHIYGRTDGDNAESAANERANLLKTLDGRHIAAGPSGAPARGRSDVFPTGRNLYTADPRTMPTPTAFDLGKAAADEVLRDYLQSHGDWPRALVIDLWGSASLRTGGEEIAQGLWLMGCRPQWDAATGRVTGVEVLVPATLGRPRVDVTFRISGLFRDMFPTQIALLDAAAQAVAARDESADENPLAATVRETGKAPARVYGSSPGTYGAGIEDQLARSDWADRSEIGHAYLAATSHAFGGAEGAATEAPGAFAERLAEADLLVHTGDDPGRDILEGSADVAFIGGFAAALAALGRNADVVVLDTTDPNRPRPRSVAQAVGRVVRARAVNPRFIAGQMRHGPRGAAEFAETVDRLVAFAETTNAISGDLIGAVHDAYLGDETVRAFLLRENPKAARAIAKRLADARRRGLWRPLRNAIDDELAELIAEAAA